MPMRINLVTTEVLTLPELMLILKLLLSCCLFPAVVGGVILLPLTFQEYSAILYSNLYSNNISGLPHPTTK